MPVSTSIPAIVLLLLNINNPVAFNTYDAKTFITSTCTPRPIETPVGVFASPTGTPYGAGSETDPLDLGTALENNNLVQDGETLWLLEGIYVGNFLATLSGTANAPINVKPYPGKRVILESPSLSSGENSQSTLFIDSQWVNYYGLEIRSQSTIRTSQETGSNPTDVNIQGGVTVGAHYNSSNTKVINFIVHDTRGGLSSFSASTNSELYGNIIYNNGWTAPDRGHGHGMYTQNKTGYKKLTNNILFFGFGTGIHAYVEGYPKLENYDIQNNVWFLAGASDPRPTQKKDNCLVGGFQPVTNLLIKNNKGYSDNHRGTRIGYGGDVTNQSAVLEDNYLAENFWVAGNWDTLNVSNTSIFHGITGASQSQINDLGGNDIREENPASGKKVFVSQNAFDPRRARIIIYNYDEDDNVMVDASSILKEGEAYRIHSVFDLFGSPLQTGIYHGSDITIPMGTVSPPQPRGVDGIGEEDDPGKKFGVFIITHAACL
jgi:hypothetical protein